MSGTFCEYGQQSGIGASCSIIRDENDKIVVVIDSGISFEKTGEFNFQLGPAGDYLRGEHVPLIVLTHEHADHFDPTLCKKFMEQGIAVYVNASTAKQIEGRPNIVEDGQEFKAGSFKSKLLNYLTAQCLTAAPARKTPVTL